MITIQSGKMIIPEEERFVGFAGDDHSSTKEFILPHTLITDVDAVFSLYLRFDDDRVTSVPLSVRIVDSDTVLRWEVRAEHLLKSGIVMAQLKLTEGDGTVTHYSWDYFIVGASAEHGDDGAEIDILCRSEFEERMAQAVREAREIAPYIGGDGYWYVYSRVQGDYVRSISATNIEVDAAVSASSTNPVENRAVKAYVDAGDSAKVDKTLRIAGVDLQDSISAAELRTALSVPEKTSELTNDSGFLTRHQDVSGKMGLASVSVPANTGNTAPDTAGAAYSALPDGQMFECVLSGSLTYWIKFTGSNHVPSPFRIAFYREIPTQVSQLTNDSGYLTQHQDISGKMGLASVSVPANSGNTAPDTASAAYTALPDGQIFECVLSGSLSYWIKFTGAGGTPYPFRIAFFADIPDVSGKENASNKVTALSAQSTDTQYPSAKCVYDLVGNVEAALAALL